MKMETTGLKALNAITSSSSFGFRSKAAYLFRRPLLSLQLRPSSLHFPLFPSNPRFSRFCTSAEMSGVNALPSGVGEAVSEGSQNSFLQVVLVSPQPLGFQVDDAKLKRAGLDYWPYVVVKVHNSWSEFRECFRKQDGEKGLGTNIHSVRKLLAFTKKGINIHSDFSYRRGDWLVFGSETSGLPSEALLDCESKSLGGSTIKIPMIETYVRCLNLSVSVGIALYEASRQFNYEQLQISSEPSCMNSETSFLTEDIFA